MFFGRCTTATLRLSFCLCLLVALVGTYLTTYRYDYYPNPNTHFYGWPMFTVAFQRQDANSPWLDFVGLPTIFAYPINLALYLFLPSTAFLILLLVRRRKAPQQA